MEALKRKQIYCRLNFGSNEAIVLAWNHEAMWKFSFILFAKK